MKNDLDIARENLSGKVRLAICKNGEVTLCSERGVAPLIKLLEENPEGLRGASVADKIVGRAAALLIIYGGVKALFTPVISERALELLRENNIEVIYMNTCIAVSNRRGDGICPMERATARITSPEEAFNVLKEKTNEQK